MIFAMRPDRKTFRVLLILFGLAACHGPKATITTNRDPSYQKEPKRLMVIETIGNELGRSHDSFKAVLTQKLEACGTAAAFIARPPRDPLALDNSAAEAEQRKENDLLRDFSPDTILLMNQTSVTRSGGSARNIVYDMQLVELPARRTVWKANLNLFTNFDIVDLGDAGAALADDLIAKLAQDSILRTCPAARS
jgi:hypothetical protein